MDGISVLLGCLFLLSVVLVGWGILRAREASLNAAQGMERLGSNHPYIVALRSGDPRRIETAPLPDFFSEELLLEGLKKIAMQPSGYDRFLERIAQQSTLRQYRHLVDTWRRYQESLGKGAAAQNELFGQLGKREIGGWEAEKVRAIIDADIAEAQLRERRAQQEGSGDPVPHSPQEEKPKQKRGKTLAEKIIELDKECKKELEKLRTKGYTEESEEWQRIINYYEHLKAQLLGES